MAWHAIYCPKCGAFIGPRPSAGMAAAAWREHILVHLRDRAWAEVNAILDDNGGVDSIEYRAAWAQWERLVGLTRIR
jgi:hypothetical protein